MAITCETTARHGWGDLRVLSNGAIELAALCSVGPRILHFGPVGGPSVLKEFEADRGADSGAWRAIGGHRFWHAPEAQPRTYTPDFEPVDAQFDGAVLRLRPPRESATGIRKEIDIAMDPTRARVHVVHRLVNEGPWPIECAPWALTVMRPGGVAILPQEPFRPHPDALLHARPVVVWPYTDMSDPRWTWGRRLIQLRQDAARPAPQKVGVYATAGWGAYLLDGLLFLKAFPAIAGAKYPDAGCNTELFTNDEMIEVESLGPLETLEPGQASRDHAELWTIRPFAPPADEDDLAEALAAIASEE